MKQLHILIIILFSIGLLITSCKSGQAPVEENTQTEGIFTVTAKEVLYATNYTYILVTDHDEAYWIAIPLEEVEVGSTFSFRGKMAMTDFQSKDLDRVFDLVYFVDEIFADGHEGHEHMHDHAPASHLQTGRQPIEQVQGISVDPAPGGISIAKLYSTAASLAGKTVILRGQVVKVNEGIMGKNWLHLQDGSSHEGKFDITVTTTVLPKVGNIITLEGIVAIDKDFGAGYIYDVIVEEARIVPAAL